MRFYSLHISRVYEMRVLCIFTFMYFRYNGRAIGNAYGPGTGTIWLDDVRCVGNETSIANCRHRGWGTHNCNHGNHGKDVSVSCGSSPVQHGWLSCYHLSRREALHSHCARYCAVLLPTIHDITVSN